MPDDSQKPVPNASPADKASSPEGASVSPAESAAAKETSTPSSEGRLTVDQARAGRSAYLLPAIALVAGLLIGGVFVALTGIGAGGSSGTSGQAVSNGAAATGSESPGSGTAGSTSATAEASASPTDITITVPAECVQLTNDSQRLLDLVDQAVTAARDLDATRLSEIVSQLKQAQEQLQQQTDACRAAAPSTS
jgi:hypothetical protein